MSNKRKYLGTITILDKFLIGNKIAQDNNSNSAMTKVTFDIRIRLLLYAFIIFNHRSTFIDLVNFDIKSCLILTIVGETS